jgi:nitrogen regulatory protein PII
MPANFRHLECGPMELVTALLRSEQFPAVKKELFDNGFRRLTATSVMGTAPMTEQNMYRGARAHGGWGRIFVTNVESAVTVWENADIVEAE